MISHFTLHGAKTTALNNFLIAPVASHLSEQNRNYNRSAEIIAFVDCDNSTNKMSECLKLLGSIKRCWNYPDVNPGFFPNG